jgi:hypothetical protein
MCDGWFGLASGRDVILEQFHVRTSALGFLEGRPEVIRAEVLRSLPKEVSERYGQTGFLLREPPSGPLPMYTFFADLHCYQPVQPGADCSHLVICWFADSLPDSIRSAVAAQLEALDWEKYAKDGTY